MNTRLYVLGMLSSGPKHGYEICRSAAEHGVDLWTDVLPGSVYYALKALASGGFAVMHEPERDGNRSRAVYAITAAGASELRLLVRSELARLPRRMPDGLYASMTFVGLFSRGDIRDAVRELLNKLNEDIVRWSKTRPNQAVGDLRAQLDNAITENGADHLEADRKFLTRILDALSD